MASDTYACSGLILPVNTDTINALGLTPSVLIDAVSQANEHITRGDLADWREMSVEKIIEEMYRDDLNNFTIYIPGANGTDLPVMVTVYRYNRDDGSHYDEMEDGFYLTFVEDQLYLRQLGPIGQALERRNVLPEFKVWSQYG